MNMPPQTLIHENSFEQNDFCSDLPFCGLGDFERLTSRLVSCGFSLIEQPQSSCAEFKEGEIRS